MTKYDPKAQSMEVLVDQCEDDWGKPEDNRDLLLPFGIRPLDLATYGMNTITGEVILIQGPEKQRKTTLTVNIVVNYMMGAKPAVKPMTVIDTLESGMTPKRYRDTLLSVVATKLMLEDGHKSREFCPVCKSPSCMVIGVNPDFLMFGTKTPAHRYYLDMAKSITRKWPLQIYGASDGEGSTRNLGAAVGGIGVTGRPRWDHLVDEYGAKVFITDHLQQYSFGEGHLSDYEKQIRTVAAVSDIVADKHIVCLLLSQVSMTSIRSAMEQGGRMTASGGNKAAAESTSIISVTYEGGASEVCITLEESRKAAPFSLYQPLEPSSGAFFGEPTSGPASQMRPGMEQATRRGNHGRK